MVAVVRVVVEAEVVVVMVCCTGRGCESIRRTSEEED